MQVSGGPATPSRSLLPVEPSGQGQDQSRRLTPDEAELYKEWIDNRRRLKRIVAEMERVSARAGQILLRQVDQDREPRGK